MWYPATVSAPTTEPVSLTQIKAQLRVDSSDEDALIERLGKAARDHVEMYCGVRFASRTSVVMRCDGFDDFARLPEAPVSSVAVTYVDTDGATQTLATSVYELRADGLESALVLKYGQSWPAIRLGSRITVTATIGYTDAPSAVVHAMLLLVAHWFARREAAGEALADVPFGVEALLTNYRRFA